MAKQKAVKEKAAQIVEIKKINLKNAVVQIVGDSPLIVHAWSSKAKGEMLDKQMKKAKGAKIAKNPQQDYEDAFYRDEDGDPAFPTIAFKAAAVAAAGRFVDGMKMTEVRGMFHIQGDLVKIEGKPHMREDMVRIASGADIRYRPEFKDWRVNLPVTFNADAISLEQIVNLFNQGGFGVGVGEWRPERKGVKGMFHVARDGE